MLGRMSRRMIPPVGAAQSPRCLNVGVFSVRNSGFHQEAPNAYHTPLNVGYNMRVPPVQQGRLGVETRPTRVQPSSCGAGWLRGKASPDVRHGCYLSRLFIIALLSL